MTRLMDRQAIERIALPLMEAHGCHTAILYGSRARGDATPQSDVDLLFVRAEGPAVQDARVADGVHVDAFVYPEAALKEPEPSLLRALGGVVLRERGDFGSAFLARLREMNDRGPAPLPEDQRRALVLWSRKMIERSRGQRGLEAEYRRMSLVIQALEDYFLLRNTWYRGPKEAFAWLRRHDEAAHTSFERATCAAATDDAIADLVQAVYGPDAPASP